MRPAHFAGRTGGERLAPKKYFQDELPSRVPTMQWEREREVNRVMRLGENKNIVETKRNKKTKGKIGGK